jgi:hypothetical protein
MELEGSEGRGYFKIDTDEGRRDIKKAIIDCWVCRDPLTLSEIAPPTSRLFFDIDTNKKDGDAEVTLPMVIEFVRGVQNFLGYLIDEKLAFNAEGAVREPERERQETRAENGWAFLPPNPDGSKRPMFRPTIAYILASDLKKTSRDGKHMLAAYHVVFPLLFGDRQVVHRCLARSFALDGPEERNKTRFRRAIAGSETVLRYVDLEVIQRGFLRAPFCDKLGAGRPYEPAAIVDQERVLLRGGSELLDDYSLVFNATTLLYVPPANTAQEQQRPPQQQLAVPVNQAPASDQSVPNRVPSIEDRTPEQWRALFRTSRREYNAAEIVELVQNIYEHYAADETSTKAGFLEAATGAVGYVLNHFTAVLRGRQRVVYVTKLWTSESTTPEFLFREEGDVEKLYSNSKVYVVWPPPFWSRQGDKVRRETLVIAPFKLWRECPHRAEFSTVVVKPPNAVPPPAPDDLNLWVPPAVSRERCMGASRHSIKLPVNREWIGYCRAWMDGGCKTAPVCSRENMFAHGAFVNGEITREEDGTFSRRFDINTFLRHIRMVICDGNIELYKFIISWFATLVQKPGHRLRSCVILVGDEGCGKNIVVDALGAILGPNHYMSTANHVDLGRFNNALCGKTLLLLNECSRFSSAEEGVLRALITEGTVRIEQKFKDPIVVDNLLNVICITNITTHNLFSTVSAKARRWCMARCHGPPSMAEDSMYWKGLWRWLGVPDGHVGAFGVVPGVLAFADFLYNHSVPDVWDSGRPPTTEELSLHKLGGMNEVAHWWHECLLSGRILDPATQTPSLADADLKKGGAEVSENAWLTGPIVVDLDRLYRDSFVRSMRGWKSGAVSSSTLPWFKKQLQELGAFYMSRPGRTGPRKRQTVLYKLATCRKHFCERYGLGDPASAFEDGIDAGEPRDANVHEEVEQIPPMQEPARGRSGNGEEAREMPSTPLSVSSTRVESALASAWERAEEIERGEQRRAEERRLAATATAKVTLDTTDAPQCTTHISADARKFLDVSAEESDGDTGEEEASLCGVAETLVDHAPLPPADREEARAKARKAAEEKLGAAFDKDKEAEIESIVDDVWTRIQGQQNHNKRTRPSDNDESEMPRTKK